MHLSDDQLRTFAAEGLLRFPGLIMPDLLEPVRSLINDWYANQLDPSEIHAYTQRTFAPDLGSHPDLVALFNRSEASDLAAHLLGVYQPVNTVQIQIRLPEDQYADAQPDKPMHVDGVACPHLDPNELRTFSLLVGVVLSDITDPASGALRYVPGGHHRMSEWFRTEWSRGMTEQVPPTVDISQSTPLLGTPGDVLLMHHLVPHSAGRNDTTNPRIMAYFRVSHVEHSNRRLQALQDPWLDYPVIRSRHDTRADEHQTGTPPAGVQRVTPH